MEYVNVIIKLIIKKDGKAVMPLNENGDLKKFSFRYDCQSLIENINGIPPLEINKIDVLSWFVDDFYFLDFLVSLGFTDEIFVCAIYFEIGDAVYDYSFLDEEISDHCWIDSPKIRLAEDFAREEPYGYNYDEYINRFGSDDSNYTYF